jgi:hypothetical protein
VWEDQAVWNVDFLSVFPNVSVNDLNKLEKYFLGLLTYNVTLKASEYTTSPSISVTAVLFVTPQCDDRLSRRAHMCVVVRRYCKYYFELRELAEKDSKSFPLMPLTTADAQRLEVLPLSLHVHGLVVSSPSIS